MAWRILSRGAIAAVVGTAMLAASSGPSAAFTLSSPSLEPAVAATAGVEPVYWRHWGWHHGWHHWGWHRGWHHWGWGRHCWIGRWGYRHCAWR